MRKNIMIFFLFSIFFSFSCFAQTNENQIIPITIGDLESFQNLSEEERQDFLFDFYEKNKERGITDGQILNELLKLDVENGKNSKFIQFISLLGKRYRDIEDIFKDTIEKINLNILEQNPGRTDLIIDIDDVDTWGNITYYSLGEKTVNDYLSVFKNKNYFSKTVITDGFSAFLTSCADKGNGKVLMAFILFPKNGNIILTQREGEKLSEIKIDFSGSENIEFDPIHFPMEKMMKVSGKKVFGYDTLFYLPFVAKLKNTKNPGIVKAVLSAEVCKDDVCHRETTEPITYQTHFSTLQASTCAKIQQQFDAAPLSKRADFKLTKAFFRKEKNGEVNLYVILDVPFLGNKKPNINVKNEQGLYFSNPFISLDGNEMLLKNRLLNPEKLQKTTDLTIHIASPGEAVEFKVQAKLDQKAGRIFFKLFSFSILDFFFAFLLGIKFLCLTPMLTAFLMLGYQAGIAERKTSERTIAFYDGLGKMFYAWCLVYLCLGLIWFYIVPDHSFFWGKQFYSPMINFIFLIVFSCLSALINKAFDDRDIMLFSERFPKMFSFFKAESVREKAGLICGFIVGLLLFITPMTSLYYEVYVLLSRSIVLYSIAFVAGTSLPFLILSLFDNSAAILPVNKKLYRQAKIILPLSLCVQIIFLAFLIGAQLGLIYFIAAVLIALMIIVFFHFKNVSSLAFMCIFSILIILSIIFIPFSANENDLNQKGGEVFNEDLLRSRVQEGKSVYLNVTENFCLLCQWNRMLIIKQGNLTEKPNKSFSIMRISYNDPFLKNLFAQSGKYNLPANIIFSPLYPEGKIVDSVFTPWTASEVIFEMTQQSKIEQDQ